MAYAVQLGLSAVVVIRSLVRWDCASEAGFLPLAFAYLIIIPPSHLRWAFSPRWHHARDQGLQAQILCGLSFGLRFF